MFVQILRTMCNTWLDFYILSKPLYYLCYLYAKYVISLWNCLQSDKCVLPTMLKLIAWGQIKEAQPYVHMTWLLTKLDSSWSMFGECHQ